MKAEQRVRIHFMDEVPRMGNGKRIVVASVGRKWVYLRDVMGRTARVSLAQYEQLKPETLSYNLTTTQGI